MTKTRNHRRSTSGNHRNGMADLRAQLNTVRQDVGDLAAEAGNVALNQLHPIEEYIQAKPIKSLLVAAGIGALVGFLMRRR